MLGGAIILRKSAALRGSLGDMTAGTGCERDGVREMKEEMTPFFVLKPLFSSRDVYFLRVGAERDTDAVIAELVDASVPAREV